ncbi:MAG TPA: hypothetical protein VF081_04230 [Solirubrobacterales bacterium]
MRAPRFRVNATQVIAWLALFVSLGGTVYAAAKINGKTIKKGSIPANRIKADSLGGAQIDEGSLGSVPSANRATEADRAAEAKLAEFADKALVAEKVATAGTAASALRATEAGKADEAVTATRATRTDLLDGLSASEYQRTCERGAILASAFVEVGRPEGGSFSCGGKGVPVVELSRGRFRMEFPGLSRPVVAVANSRVDDTAASIVPDETVTADAPPTFILTIFETSTQTRTLAAQVLVF